MQVDKVRAYFGRSGDYCFAAENASALKIHRGWLSNLDPRFDLGLIKLASDVGSKTFTALGGQKLGCWDSVTNGFGTKIKQHRLYGKTIHVAGYPGDKGDWLVRAKDKIVNTNPRAGSELIYYKTDTCSGQSGGPAWLEAKSGKQYLIAVHTGPCILQKGVPFECSSIPDVRTPCRPWPEKHSSNRGVFLSKNVIDLIYEWIRTI